MDDHELTSLFWVNLLVATALSILMVAFAPLVGEAYHNPGVGQLVAAMGVAVVLTSLGTVQASILARQMRFGSLAVVEIVSAIANLAASVVSAIAGLGFWAVYVGTIVAALTNTGGYWLLSRWVPSGVHVRGVGSSVRFGAGVAGFNLTNFFARNLDNILIGLRWGEIALGMYDRAYKLLLFPLQQINNPVSRVMVPALSRKIDDGAGYRRAYLAAQTYVLMVALPGTAVMILCNHELVYFALGEQWSAAAEVFGILGYVAILQTLNNPAGWLFISQGRGRDFFSWGAFNAVSCAIAFAAGLPFGPSGVATAYAISEVIRTPLLWLFVGRRGPVSAGDVLANCVPWFLGVAACLAWGLFLKEGLGLGGILAVPVQLICAFVVCTSTALLFRSGRDHVNRGLAVIRGVTKPKSKPNPSEVPR